jgi:hypothetical protein
MRHPEYSVSQQFPSAWGGISLQTLWPLLHRTVLPYPEGLPIINGLDAIDTRKIQPGEKHWGKYPG